MKVKLEIHFEYRLFGNKISSLAITYAVVETKKKPPYKREDFNNKEDEEKIKVEIKREFEKLQKRFSTNLLPDNYLPNFYIIKAVSVLK